MTEIKPATDEQVEELREKLRGYDHGEVTLSASAFAAGCEVLIARIEADRTEIATLRETNTRLNRRASAAEAAVLQAVKGSGGASLGRALANAACGPLRRENAEQSAEIATLRAENERLKRQVEELEVFKALVLRYVTPVNYETVTTAGSIEVGRDD